MKVTRAIEILTRFIICGESKGPVKFDNAINLGIEALERHRNRDYLAYNELHHLLPGESPEEDI